MNDDDASGKYFCEEEKQVFGMHEKANCTVLFSFVLTRRGRGGGGDESTSHPVCKVTSS